MGKRTILLALKTAEGKDVYRVSSIGVIHSVFNAEVSTYYPYHSSVRFHMADGRSGMAKLVDGNWYGTLDA